MHNFPNTMPGMKCEPRPANENGSAGIEVPFNSWSNAFYYGEVTCIRYAQTITLKHLYSSPSPHLGAKVTCQIINKVSALFCRLDGILNFLVYQWADAFLWLHFYYWYRSISCSSGVRITCSLVHSALTSPSYLSFPQLVTSRGYGLTGYWFVLIGFQWVRTTSPACIRAILSNWTSLTTYKFCFSGTVFPLTSAPSVSQWHALLWRFGSSQIGKAEGCLV